jgi:hypothetical protein
MSPEIDRTLLGCMFIGISWFVDGTVGWVIFIIGALLVLWDFE